MKTAESIRPSEGLKHVRYEIRGRLARRAHEMERQGYEIVSLNIGNPRAFGFRTPETMRLAMIENLAEAEGYCHQKGIFPAREAVVMQQQARGVTGVTAEEVFIGNGVSELIDLVLRALLNDGDEVLVPSPDYPLWTAAVTLNRGRAVHYPCRPENGFVPDPQEMKRLITPRTRAMVVINPNNPTGAVYPRRVLEEIARLPSATAWWCSATRSTTRCSMTAPSSCPWRRWCATRCVRPCRGCPRSTAPAATASAGRCSPAARRAPREYLSALELLSSLRLCSNVPAQWAVQTALGGYQSIRELVVTGRATVRVARARCWRPRTTAATCDWRRPPGAMYAFVGVDPQVLPDFDDQRFALDLLEQKHVLVAPGVSFNVPYRNHFRITNLPDAVTLKECSRASRNC